MFRLIQQQRQEQNRDSLLCKRGTNVTTSGKLTLAAEFYCDVNGMEQLIHQQKCFITLQI